MLRTWGLGGGGFGDGGDGEGGSGDGGGGGDGEGGSGDGGGGGDGEGGSGDGGCWMGMGVGPKRKAFSKLGSSATVRAKGCLCCAMLHRPGRTSTRHADVSATQCVLVVF